MNRQQTPCNRSGARRDRRLICGLSVIVALAAITAPALAAASAASADHWNTARWQALLNAVPAPPPTLARAGAMIGPVTDADEHPALWVTDPTLQRLHAQRQAGMDAMQTAALAGIGAVVPGGIDYARMRSDPAYAKEVNQRLVSLTMQQRVQMAMQAAQARSGSMTNTDTVNALQNYLLVEQRARLDGINRNAAQSLQKIMAGYDKRHVALDAALLAKLKACPQVHGGGDMTIADPRCVAGINAQLPDLITKHRQLAQAELNEERALFTRTRSALQPIMAKAAGLAEAAERAGAGAASLQRVFGQFDTEAYTLLSLTDTATLRAGFWQDIRQHKMDEFALYGYRGPLELTAPPSEPPKGW